MGNTGRANVLGPEHGTLVLIRLLDARFRQFQLATTTVPIGQKHQPSQTRDASIFRAVVGNLLIEKRKGLGELSPQHEYAAETLAIDVRPSTALVAFGIRQTQRFTQTFFSCGEVRALALNRNC